MRGKRDTIAPTMMPSPAGVSGSDMARSVDPWMAGAVVLLLSLGTVLVYSASAVRAQNISGSSDLFLLKHLSSIAVGLVLAAIAMRIPIETWSKLAYPMLALSVVLLLLVFVPGIGKRVNGAVRFRSISSSK